MQLLFLLISACLVLLAFLFILPPLWRPAEIELATDDRNITIAKQRLAELKAQLRAGDLTQTQYDEQRAELEQSLSNDLALETPTLDSNKQGRGLSYVLLIAIPVLAFSLYALLGTMAAIDPTPEMIAGKESTLPDQAAISKMVEGLAEKMKTDPKNAQGWLMLAKSYKYLEQYDKAADAYTNAYKLLGDKPDIMLAYAEALSFANHQQITEQAAELIFKALKLAPDDPNALWLAGMAKVQAGEFSEAKTLWTKLASTMQQDSAERQAMQDLLKTVDTKLAAQSNGAIRLLISLSPELKTDADDTVFIYAQATDNKLPLAIVRKTVRDLPIEVILNDALAMTPDNKLSNFKTVKVLARVSKSGNAMPQTGDLIGTLDNVTVSDKTSHTLIINSIVK